MSTAALAAVLALLALEEENTPDSYDDDYNNYEDPYEDDDYFDEDEYKDYIYMGDE